MGCHVKSFVKFNKFLFLCILIVLPKIALAKDLKTDDRQKITLTLQAIQSNFLGANNAQDGNNGFPIPGLSTPIEITVRSQTSKHKVALSIESFSFSLPAKGFLISMTVLPQNLVPSSAKWIDFNAGPGIEGHVFRDGSIRFSGLNNEPLVAGNYTVLKSDVSFSTALIPQKPKGFFFSEQAGGLVKIKNFPISKGFTNLNPFIAGKLINDFFDYGEYFGMVFHDGEILTATTDNSFDNRMTPIAVFNKVDSKGNHLLPQVDIVPPGFANAPVDPVLAEETLSINPANPNQLAMTVLVNHVPVLTLRHTFVGISNDGGKTWQIVDPLANVGPLPQPPGFVPGFTGDQGVIFDSYGNLFYVDLMGYRNIDDPSVSTAFASVYLSSDGGMTWKLIDFLTGINPQTFGLDYPILASTPVLKNRVRESSVTWLMLKQDESFAEILAFGSTFPVMMTAYKTTGLGQLVEKRSMEIPGSENGGFGNIAVGHDGSVLVSGSSFNNALGSLPYTNITIWTSFNRDGFEGSFSPIKFAANSNTGYDTSYYIPQQFRNTWSHPNVAIDARGRWYLVYIDQPTPHVVVTNPNVYLIYSDDKGKHWSTPVRLNNDVSNLSFQFMPQIAVDPITNDLAVTWLDTREDERDTSTRVWGMVIKDGSLPNLKKASF